MGVRQFVTNGRTQSSSPSLPSAPTYQAPAAYTNPGPYQGPGQYINPGAPTQGPTSSGYNPATAGQTLSSAVAADSLLPTDLQISNANSVLSPDARQRYEDLYYNQYLKPGLAQTQAGLYANGQADSTFGGAVLGQALAQGAATKMFAGEDLYNSRLQNLLNMRNNFFQNEGQLAQNAESNKIQNSQFNANLGMTNAQMLNNWYMQNAQNQNQFNLSNSANQNQYNLASAGMRNNYNMGSAGAANSFNLGNFNNQLNAYNAQVAQQRNNIMGYGNLAAGVGGLAVGAYNTLNTPSQGSNNYNFQLPKP